MAKADKEKIKKKKISNTTSKKKNNNTNNKSNSSKKEVKTNKQKAKPVSKSNNKPVKKTTNTKTKKNNPQQQNKAKTKINNNKSKPNNSKTKINNNKSKPNNSKTKINNNKTNIKNKQKQKKSKQIKKTNLTNTEIIEQIINKKKTKKQQNQQKIIEKEISSVELSEYLKEEKEELENTLLLNELAEKVKEQLEIDDELKNKPAKEEPKKKKLEKLEKEEPEEKEEIIVDDLERKVIKQIEKSRKIKRFKFHISELSILIILSITLIIVLSIAIINNRTSQTVKIERIKKEEPIVIEDDKKRLEDINLCMNKEFNESDTSKEIETYLNDLNSNLSTAYNISVIYKDIERGFTYSLHTDQVYYAASTIKALDALYIYDKASKGELKLDDTITYSSKYTMSSSKYMQTRKPGEKITIKELVKAAVEVSDNTAHNILLSYIGKNNLREYGKSLGATNTLTSGDGFGNITVDDAIIYMNAIYNFIKDNNELGEELKSFFLNAEQNDLAVPEYHVEAAHKYGEYKEFYHDIGIVYDKHPYLIAILTKEGRKDFENIVKDINKKIYELHLLYYSNREKICEQK